MKVVNTSLGGQCTRVKHLPATVSFQMLFVVFSQNAFSDGKKVLCFAWVIVQEKCTEMFAFASLFGKKLGAFRYFLTTLSGEIHKVFRLRSCDSEQAAGCRTPRTFNSGQYVTRTKTWNLELAERFYTRFLRQLKMCIFFFFHRRTSCFVCLCGFSWVSNENNWGLFRGRVDNFVDGNADPIH